jgi:hypothetical protein
MNATQKFKLWWILSLLNSGASAWSATWSWQLASNSTVSQNLMHAPEECAGYMPLQCALMGPNAHLPLGTATKVIWPMSMRTKLRRPCNRNNSFARLDNFPHRQTQVEGLLSRGGNPSPAADVMGPTSCTTGGRERRCGNSWSAGDENTGDGMLGRATNITRIKHNLLIHPHLALRRRSASTSQ